MRLKESSLCLLASVASVDMQTVAKNSLYTVPPAKKAIVTHVVVRELSASLAGGTDYDIGDGADCDTWKQTNNLSGMTSTSNYMVITSDNTTYSTLDAGDVFGIKPITGSTAAATATLDVFGYEFDA